MDISRPKKKKPTGRNRVHDLVVARQRETIAQLRRAVKANERKGNIWDRPK